jgi:hypothetical protein
VSRHSRAAFLSALLLVALPGAAIAQDDASDLGPTWRSVLKKGASDVTAFDNGYVLAGGMIKQASTKVWTSADGRAWSKVSDSSLKGAPMTRVAAHDGGLVGFGSQGRKLIGWSSADGASWKKSTIDKAGEELMLSPAAVTDGPAGLLMVAHLIGQDLAGQRMYQSSDGQEWTKVDPPLEPSEGIIVSLKADDTEYLAIARSAFDPDREFYWRSPDGATWESFAGPENGWLYDIAIGPEGSYAAVGHLVSGDEVRSAIWHASELGSWELVHSSPSDKMPEELLNVIEAAGPGFLATGITSDCPGQASRSCPVAAILGSADGVEWAPMGIAEGVPGPLHDTAVSQIASNGDNTVMLAWHQDRPLEVWTQPAAE